MTRLSFAISTFSFIIITLNQVQVHGLLNITNEAIAVGRKLIEEVENDKRYPGFTEVDHETKHIVKDIIAPFKNLVRKQNRFEAHLLYGNDDKCLNNIFLSDYENLRHKNEAEFFRFLFDYPVTMLGPLDSEKLELFGNNQKKIYKNKTITELLNNVHSAVTTLCQSRLVEIFNKHAQDCIFTMSHQQLFYGTIQGIALLDAQYYVVSQLARAYLKISFTAQDSDDLTKEIKRNVDSLKKDWNNTLDMLKLMKDAEPEFIERNLKSLKFYKAAMKNKKLDTWLCNDSKKLLDITFTHLNLFKRYIVNEVNLNPDGTCTRDCPYYKNTKVYGCFDKDVCANRKQCNGRIVGCSENINRGRICPSDDRLRYYNRFVINNYYEYKYRSEECKNEIPFESWTRGFTQCSYCMCTCETSENESDRYVNLRPVTSNVMSNYVVTGVRLTKWNNILHLQIEEGKLLTEGLTVLQEWKNIDDYTTKDINVVENIDYHVISWEKGRTVALDKLHAPGNKALTGLRFKYADGDLLKLEIQVTEFNFTSGQLFPNTSYWLSNEAGLETRSEVNLDDMKEAEHTVYNTDQFVKFTTSLKYDAGQNTFPFIGISSLSPETSGPMSGAGLYIENVKDLGPTLGLRLLTFDVEPYINV